MSEIVEYIIAGIIAVLLGGIVLPLFLNWANDKWGWFE